VRGTPHSVSWFSCNALFVSLHPSLSGHLCRMCHGADAWYVVARAALQDTLKGVHDSVILTTAKVSQQHDQVDELRDSLKTYLLKWTGQSKDPFAEADLQEKKARQCTSRVLALRMLYAAGHASL